MMVCVLPEHWQADKPSEAGSRMENVEGFDPQSSSQRDGFCAIMSRGHDRSGKRDAPEKQGV